MLATALAIFCACPCSRAEGKARQQLVVFLPEQRFSANSLPSDAFMATLGQAEQAFLQIGGDVAVSVVTTDSIAAKYAQIVLVSYGVSDDRVRIVKSASDIEALDSAIRVGKAGGTSAAPVTAPARSATQASFRQAFVVLGNRPLDDHTPTVDMVQRVLTAIDRARPYGRGAAFIFTGAATEGNISEAKMMALIALARGTPRDQLILEEESWTTGRNAFYTAPIVSRLHAQEVFIVTKRSHHAFAREYFRQYPQFRRAVEVVSPEMKEETLAQMADYLRRHDSGLVRNRIQALRNDSHGID
jgi:hypothetical protein